MARGIRASPTAASRRSSARVDRPVDSRLRRCRHGRRGDDAVCGPRPHLRLRADDIVAWLLCRICGGEGGGGLAVPPNLSIVEAGAMPVDAMTALRGLEDTPRVRAGEAVTVLGGSGEVGHLNDRCRSHPDQRRCGSESRSRGRSSRTRADVLHLSIGVALGGNTLCSGIAIRDARSCPWSRSQAELVGAGR